MDNPLHVTLYDKTFVRTAWLDDLDRLSVKPRHLAISGCEFDVPTDYRFLPELTDPGARITVELEDEQVFSGPLRAWSGTGPNAEGMLTFTVDGDERLLWNLLGYPVPTNAAETQPAKEDARTGPAETVVKGLVTANVARWGRPYTVAPDLGRGGTVTVALRMMPLAEKLLPAIDRAGIGVTVRQVGAGLVVDCYAPKLFPLNLSEDGGMVRDYSPSFTPPTATRAIIGGPNTGTSREFKSYVDTAREAKYGDVIEIFVDAADQTLAADIIAKGKAAVDEAREKYGIQITLDETSVFRYGGPDGIHVGDTVAAEPAGGVPPVTAVVRGADLTFDRDNGYRADFTVGDEDPDNPDQIVSETLDQLVQAVHELRTR